MQVQGVNGINNNPNFGDLKGILCHGSFSKQNPRHALAINEVLASDVFKKFGEKYDYIAHFKRRFTPSFYDGIYYELSLAPVKEMTFIDKIKNLFNRSTEQKVKEEDGCAKKLQKLPIKFTVATSYLNLDSEACSFFIKCVERTSLSDLESKLEKSLPKSYKEKAAAKQAFENIENSEIPIN